MKILQKIIEWIEHKMQHYALWQRWIPAVLWYVIIGVVSHLPAASSVSTGVMVGGDNALNTALRTMAHIVEFSILSLLIYIAQNSNFTNNVRSSILTYSMTFVCAITDEVHQHFVPGRFARIQDVVIDTVGASIVLMVILRIVLWIKVRATQSVF